VIKLFKLGISAFILCFFVSTLAFSSPVYLDQAIEDNCGIACGLTSMSFNEIDEGYHYTLVPRKKKASRSGKRRSKGRSEASKDDRQDSPATEKDNEKKGKKRGKGKSKKS
jgi:hypothetical protein